MNAAPAAPPPHKWTLTHWLVAILIVFTAHVALIYVFGIRKHAPRESIQNAPSLALVDGYSGDWLSLNNASLFALPDRDGFAGLMWIALPPLPFRKQEWTEQPRWLSLSTNGLGTSFNDFVQTNSFAGVSFEVKLAPPLTVPLISAQPQLASNSTLQVEGEITKRPLRNTMNLPSWPNSDVIAPSVVQVLVDGAGNVVSAALLPPENYTETSAVRDPDADRAAVELARTARFAALIPGDNSITANPISHLAIGQLIFNWQTVPVIPTNAPE
jgi:hypothetical protein